MYMSGETEPKLCGGERDSSHFRLEACELELLGLKGLQSQKEKDSAKISGPEELSAFGATPLSPPHHPQGPLSTPLPFGASFAPSINPRLEYVLRRRGGRMGNHRRFRTRRLAPFPGRGS
ncbi:hypothetical protein NL676_003362 [Syzygium grande]|nr:hypothetical protein NL676_003362 [Syzygium grande]